MDNGSFQFGYGNQANKSDWAKYAHFDRTTGMIAPVAPPASSGGAQPPLLSNVYNSVKSNIQQGNFGGAAKAALGIPALPNQTQQTNQQPDQSGFQYEVEP